MDKDNIYNYIEEQLGATRSLHRQVFTVYIPNKDNKNIVIENHDNWVTRISKIMAEVCGGCTMYSTKGMWFQEKEIIQEDTVIVYSYITDDEKFLKGLTKMRKILHEFGIKTSQDAVAFEFDSVFYLINFN